MKLLCTDIIFSFLLGAFVGSYIVTILARVRAGEKIRGGYSHCLSCGSRLSRRNIIPVWSYLYYRGRCPHCQVVIGRSTLYWEVGVGLLFSLVTLFTHHLLDIWTVLFGILIAGTLQLVMKVK